MGRLASRFKRVTGDIERLTALYRRPAGSVRLIAVSKQQGADRVAALAGLGQRDFAENYVQEGLGKIQQSAQQLPGAALCWHFIGHIQSRKCGLVAEHFDWVHSVDSAKVAQRLSRSRAGGKPLNVLIQLNLQGEESKHGVSEAELPALAEATAALPHLRLRGLMIVPKLEQSPARQRDVFRRCRQLCEALNARGLKLDHLSMGMSGDMEAAIAEGATMVRIGTAVFGPRPAAALRH